MMMTLEKLSSITHKHTKVSVHPNTDDIANIHMAHIVPQEYKNIAQHYPIFFAKDDETGQFNIVALLGLNVSENLFVNEGKWQNNYVPLQIQTMPFSLIEDSQELNGKLISKPALAIDMASNRVQNEHGEALFAQGHATQYLQQQTTLLTQFIEGTKFNTEFIKALLAENLLESVNLDITFENGENLNLQGLYTINKEMLVQVDKTAQQEFENQGYVALITDIIASLRQVETLIARKNDKLKSVSVS